ncbi:plasma protease C1 inhibitor-like [Heterodontus francisci]|uniref:plasma protease C1 inhibitor-like n=1 Tax=Heterodontus francisci TaxID=7792 RepID=UPI00355B0F57
MFLRPVLLLQATCVLYFVGAQSKAEPLNFLQPLPPRMERQNVKGLQPAVMRPLEGCTPSVTDHCAQYPDPWRQCGTASLDERQLGALTTSLTHFGLDAYKIIAKYNTGANVLISPVSLAVALTHLLLGKIIPGGTCVNENGGGRRERCTKLIIKLCKAPTIGGRKIFNEAPIAKFQMFGGNSLVIIIPQDPNMRLSKTERALNFEKLSAIMDKLHKIDFKQTNVMFPKLSLNFNQDLLLPFSDMGLQDVLEQPNLCGMSADRQLAISGAEHRAVLAIDEEGVEAAAVTAISVARNVLVFEVQRPFILLLWNDARGYPLFLGRVLDPSQ